MGRGKSLDIIVGVLYNITGCTSRFHSHWVYMQWLLWVWFANLTLQKSQHFPTKCSCYVLKAPFPGKWPDNIAPIKTIFNNLAFAYNINFYIKQNNSCTYTCTCLRDQHRNSILMCHYPDLSTGYSASDWLNICSNQSEALFRSG